MTAVEKRRLGEGVHAESMFSYRYADSSRRFENSYGSRNPIRYGDRLMARVIVGGRTVVEFIVNQVSDLSDLYGELRKKTRGLCGLVSLYVRNFTRGWSFERPWMLYPAANPGSSTVSSSASVSPATPEPARRASRMLFPWETH